MGEKGGGDGREMREKELVKKKKKTGKGGK